MYPLNLIYVEKGKVGGKLQGLKFSDSSEIEIKFDDRYILPRHSGQLWKSLFLSRLWFSENIGSLILKHVVFWGFDMKYVERDTRLLVKNIKICSCVCFLKFVYIVVICAWIDISYFYLLPCYMVFTWPCYQLHYRACICLFEFLCICIWNRVCICCYVAILPFLFLPYCHSCTLRLYLFSECVCICIYNWVCICCRVAILLFLVSDLAIKQNLAYCLNTEPTFFTFTQNQIKSNIITLHRNYIKFDSKIPKEVWFN